MADNLYYVDGKTYLVKSTGGPLEIDSTAFLSETLARIWETIKRQNFASAMRIVKVVALLAGVILLSHNLSVAGILTLMGAIAGLLFAAITNVLVWLLYIPMYFLKSSDFFASVMLALGLAWFVGISSFAALVLSPLVIVGFRMLSRSEIAQMQIGEIPGYIAERVEKTNIGAGIQQAADTIASFIGGLIPS